MSQELTILKDQGTDSDFLRKYWNSSIEEISDMIKKGEEELDLSVRLARYKSITRQFYKRDVLIIRDRVKWLKKILKSKQTNPSYVPDHYKLNEIKYKDFYRHLLKEGNSSYESLKKNLYGWMRKDGEFFEVRWMRHRDDVEENPEKFGLTHKDIVEWKDKFMYELMYKNGWVRIDYGGNKARGQTNAEGLRLSSSQKKVLEDLHFDTGRMIIWYKLGSAHEIQLFPSEDILEEIVTAPHGTDARELAMGMTLEMENTDSEEVAHAIVLKNLKQNPHYYTDLKKRGHPVLNDISPSSELGNPDNAINKKQRHGTDLTPTPGNNVAGKMENTPRVEGTDGKISITEEIEKAEMILASPSLESALRKLVGTPLDKLHDKISFMNLYIGNKYGVGGTTPEKELSMQKFLNAIVLWIFQKKVWPTNQMFDRQIENAKKGKMSTEFRDYMDKEQAVRVRLSSIFKKALSNKTRSTDDPEYKSANQERSSLYDTHPWMTFENSLRKEKDQLIKINSSKPITIEDVTPTDDDILEAKNTYKQLKKGWDGIHHGLHQEMAQISKVGKTVMAGSSPLKDLSLESVDGNVVFFRMDKGGMFAPGFSLVYFLDSDESAKDMKEGKIPYLMVPRGTFFSGGSPITDIWKKKFQKPGTEHILGVLEGNSNENNIFVDMITVRPGFQRNSIASKMLASMKKDFPNAKVFTSSKTPQGEKFFKSTVKEIIGSKMLGKGLSTDQHGKRWTIRAYPYIHKSLTPKMKENFKKMIKEMSYAGNVGLEEVVNFFRLATNVEKEEFLTLLDQEKIKEAWELLEHVLHVKLI